MLEAAQAAEIALLRGRGASMVQVGTIYLFQGLLLGLPAMGAAGAAFATSLVRWAMLAALAGYVLLAPSLRATGVRAPPRWSRAIQMRLLRLGMPFAISQGLETSAFQSVTLICGWLGPTALAAFQIALG